MLSKITFYLTLWKSLSLTLIVTCWWVTMICKITRFHKRLWTKKFQILADLISSRPEGTSILSHLVLCLLFFAALLWPANIQDCMLSKVSLTIDTGERKAQTNGPGCAPSITPTEDSLFADFNLEEFLLFFSCETHKSWADKESRAVPSWAGPGWDKELTGGEEEVPPIWNRKLVQESAV